MELVELDRQPGAQPTGGRVRLKGPLGFGRTAQTRVLATAPPRDGEATLHGVAELGRGTLGRVRWSISRLADGGSDVTLTAVVERAALRDRVLLALGGRRWLELLFASALANLEAVLAGEDVGARAGRHWVADGLVAGAVAAVASGAPSTIAALARGDDPLAATLAAGSITLPNERRRGVLLAAAAPVHVGLSLGWGLVLSRTLPARRTVAAGALAGLAIAALDLGVLGRRLPRIRSLPLGPQLADHVAFGAIVGAVLARRRSQ